MKHCRYIRAGSTRRFFSLFPKRVAGHPPCLTSKTYLLNQMCRLVRSGSGLGTFVYVHSAQSPARCSGIVNKKLSCCSSFLSMLVLRARQEDPKCFASDLPAGPLLPFALARFFLHLLALLMMSGGGTSVFYYAKALLLRARDMRSSVVCHSRALGGGVRSASQHFHAFELRVPFSRARQRCAFGF